MIIRIIVVRYTAIESRDTDGNYYIYSSDYSLSKACSSLLGRPLLKEEQISDWDSVALTSNQLSYAALDAHCLLGLLHSVITGLISSHDGPDKTHREMLLGWTDIDVDGMYVQTDFPDIHDSLDEDRDVDLLESIEVEKEEKGVGNVEDDTTATLCVDLDSAKGNGIVVSSSDNNQKIDVILKKKYRSPAPDTKHFAMSAWLSDSSSKSAT